MTYKVWIQIEALPANRDPYNVDEPVDIAEFERIGPARKLLTQIVDAYVPSERKEDWKQRDIYPFNAEVRS